MPLAAGNARVSSYNSQNAPRPVRLARSTDSLSLVEREPSRLADKGSSSRHNRLHKVAADNGMMSGECRADELGIAFAGQVVPQNPDAESAEALLDRIREERSSATVKRPKTASRSKKDQYVLW